MLRSLVGSEMCIRDRCAVFFCGVVFQLLGCGLLAYDIYYFIDETKNNLAYCVLALALANILAGILAFCFAPSGHSRCLLVSYVTLLILLICTELATGIILKTDEDAAREWLTDDCSKDDSCSHSMKSAETGFDKHQDTFFYALVSLVGFKLVAILIACCHSSTARSSSHSYRQVSTTSHYP
eukprot:TRINITY_DN1893_c0_g1_i3.p1 TRINITY_DN1893_c0_g1~~TRINITY_DN1893_c0_g1_i3.p1  ORF type:complete len:182 (-),score=53.18 TRINITY_DN1893_c0_g1_i3:272-817(-)